MSQETARVLHASGAETTASGQTAAVDLGADTTLDLDLSVSVISGAGAILQVTLQTSRDGAVGWADVEPKYWDNTAAAELTVRFPAFAAAGAAFRVFPDLQRWVRVRWTLAGTTPSTTFSVAGNSVRVYARVAEVPELRVGINCATISDERIDRAVRAESDKADSAFSMQMPTPLSVWSSYVRQGVASCAAATIIAEDDCKKLRQKDEWIKSQCAAFDAWLTLVAEGKRTLPGAVDPTPTVDDGGAYAVSDAKRGW